jgi:membrane protease YdiL (CAAX protease family)
MSEIQLKQERSMLASIFISSDEPRLRAVWRLLSQLIIYILLSIILFDISSALGHESSVSSILDRIFDLVALTSSVYIIRRWLDKRSFESLGLKINRKTLVDIFAGIGITLIMMGSIFAVLLGFGWLTFTGFAWQFDPISVVLTNIATFLIVFILVGWNEELFSRGYQLQTIASGLNLFWGAGLSAAVFGLIHLRNPHATWVSTAGIFFAGIFFAYAYIRTKQLWLPIGLHLGWNFFEGVVFGFPVSGLEIYRLVRIQVNGPEFWTGGQFGPEAGLIILPSMVLGGMLIYWYTRNRKSTDKQPD